VNKVQDSDTFSAKGVDIGGGVIMYHAVPYGQAPRRGAMQTLHVDLYHPASATGPVPVFVWFHSGAFRSGGYSRVPHKVMARWLGQRGIALATPEYRLGALKSDLSPGVLAQLDALRLLRSRKFRRDLAQARSLAALEDSFEFLSWLDKRRDDLGVAGKIVLGGSSAGAINAFNICFTAPYLKLDHAGSFGGIIGFSGGYAYPSLYEPEKLPIMAAHNPDDDRVSIASIRELAQRDAMLELIESREQDHGEARLWRNETKADSFGRIAENVWRMSGVDRV